MRCFLRASVHPFRAFLRTSLWAAKKVALYYCKKRRFFKNDHFDHFIAREHREDFWSVLAKNQKKFVHKKSTTN